MFLWVGRVFRLGLGLWCWGEGVAVSGRVRVALGRFGGPRERGFSGGSRHQPCIVEFQRPEHICPKIDQGPRKAGFEAVDKKCPRDDKKST